MLVRNDDITKAVRFDCGVELIKQNGRVHLIYKDRLNVSVCDIAFHAGDINDFVGAMLSLFNEDPSGLLADFTSIASA